MGETLPAGPIQDLSGLFVGYGHNDTVMNYLARALPADQTQPRLVLTDETDADRWAVLGITPVLFPKTDAYDYSGLYKGIAGLAKYSTGGILDWQSRITEIAMNPPSLDQETMDLIEDGSPTQPASGSSLRQPLILNGLDGSTRMGVWTAFLVHPQHRSRRTLH